MTNALITYRVQSRGMSWILITASDLSLDYKTSLIFRYDARKRALNMQNSLLFARMHSPGTRVINADVSGLVLNELACIPKAG